MKNILIISEPNDFHALAVAWAIEKLGHKVEFWCMSDFPMQQKLTICSLDELKPEIIFKSNYKKFYKNDINVVWMRRYYPPTISSKIHNSDQLFAKTESINTIRSICYVMAESCEFWVNPWHSNVIESKALQLKIASDLNISIPKTIISNDPDEIRLFFHTYKKNIIHKSSMPMIWESMSSTIKGETTMLTQEDLQDDKILSACPGIFQSYVEKKYEVRITVFGKLCIAIKLHSQENEPTIDWRMPLLTVPFPIERISLPDKIKSKIFAFMERTNLLFACFDFIVTKSEEWVFLEINPMGQFLWIEELCPEIRLLEIFSRFLVSENPDFSEEDIKNCLLQLREFENNACEEIHSKFANLHVSPRNTSVAIEEG